MENHTSHKIVGHRSQCARLGQLFADGKLPHSLLFSGPSGIGKYLIASKLAAKLLCSAPNNLSSPTLQACGECSSCKLIAAGNHPDLYRLNLVEKQDSAIDSLRDLLSRLSLGAFYGGARVILLREIDALGVQASNLLLKTLEEPREQIYFISTSSNPARLLPTIKSRCQEWSFDLLSEREVLAALEQRYPDTAPESLPPLAKLCDGSLEALQIFSPDGNQPQMAFWREITTTLDKVFAGELDVGIKLADKLVRDKAEINLALLIMRVHTRERMLNANKDSERVRWAVALQNVLAMHSLIDDRNLNIAYLLQKLCIGLAGCTAPTSKLMASPNSADISMGL